MQWSEQKFQKIPPSTKQNPPSTFIDFPFFVPPPRLFQAPRLVIFHFLHPLHVYSKLHVY